MNYVWVQSRSSFLWGIFSFGVTITRLLMAVLFFFDLWVGRMTSSYFPIFAIIAIVFMDHIDGKLFKKTFLSQIESWKNGRRIFDSICDRLCIQLFCIPILVLEPKFLGVYIIILIKEILTSIYCIKAYIDNIILTSNTVGKVSCIVIGVTVVMWLLHLYYLAYCIAPVILITGYISYRKYCNSYKNILMTLNNSRE